MGSRFVVGCERAEDPNDVEKAASTSEMSVALKARKGKNNDNKNNKNNNKKANNDARHAFETKSPWGIYTHPAMLFALGMLLGVLVRFSYTTVGQRHVRAHKDAWQAYMETYREHMYGHNNDTVTLFEEEMLKKQETKVEEALRRVEDTAVVEEVATALDANASAPTLPSPEPFDETKCKLVESFGNHFQRFEFREFLPSEEDGYPQIAETGWEPFRWRDNKLYISTWTSLNAQGTVNKVLSTVTLDDKRACVAEVPERLASEVAIVHFRCADIPFSDELSYPLAPPEYSVFVGKQFNKHSVKRIIPIMCSVHKVDERMLEQRKRLCTELFNAQLDIIKHELTEEVSIDTISCRNDVETLFLSRDAAAVAQLIPSSFTFIPGLARSDAKSFITPHYGLKGLKAIQILGPLDDRLRMDLRNMVDHLPWTMFCPGCGEGQDVFYPESGFTGWNYSFAHDRLMQFHKELLIESNNNNNKK